MTISQSAILSVGKFQFARREWEALHKGFTSIDMLDYPNGSRQDFIAHCQNGSYDKVMAIYRSNESTVITGRFDKELIDALPQSVRYICHNGAGYDNIDIETCTARGIQVSNTPQVVDAATADTTIFLMLGALRLANISQYVLRSGQWGKPGAAGASLLPMAHDPQGKILGILGMGSIGQAVAIRARALGMRIQYHNRRRLAADLENETGAQYVDFDTLLATSDVLSLHLNLSSATRHIIGKPELAKMKQGATLVNTARGALINEAALVEALDSEAGSDTSPRLWSAGLDVFENEPEVHPGLLRNQRVFLLPHIGTMTVETRRAMEMLAIRNVENVLRDQGLLTQVGEQSSML